MQLYRISQIVYAYLNGDWWQITSLLWPVQRGPHPTLILQREAEQRRYPAEDIFGWDLMWPTRVL